jgi:hypothetical protein
MIVKRNNGLTTRGRRIPLFAINYGTMQEFK